jgi:hypothetical protein
MKLPRELNALLQPIAKNGEALKRSSKASASHATAAFNLGWSFVGTLNI